MARLSVEVDLATLLFQYASGDLQDKLQSITGDKDFYKTMADFAKQLEILEQSTKDEYWTLRRSIKNLGYFDSDGIFDQISNILSQENISTIERQNLAKNIFLGDPNNKKIQSIEEQIERYIQKCDKIYEEMIEKSRILREIGETIREDKMYYALGSQDTTGLIINMFKGEDYENFERNARSIFSLRFDSEHAGITLAPKGFGLMQKVVQEQSQLYSSLVLDDAFMSNHKTTGGLSYRDIWQTLHKSKIETGQSQYDRALNSESIPRYFRDSKKFEMLLQGYFDQAQSMEDVQKIINSFNTSENALYLENIFGAATGDTNLVVNNLITGEKENIAVQAKWYNGYHGWNGTSLSGLVRALKFFSDEKLVNECINLQDMSTEQIGNFFDEHFFTKDFDITSFVDSNYLYEIGTNTLVEAGFNLEQGFDFQMPPI